MLALKDNNPKANQQYDYDFLVFIGRFQPFHKGHEHVISVALRKARHVIVLIGSSKCARSLRNPFTWQERASMIKGAFDVQDYDRLHLTPLLDLPYAEDTWAQNVKHSAQGIVCQYQVNRTPKIGLIGHSKDESSYYLNMFPQWESENVSKTVEIDATDVRDPYLASGNVKNAELLPDSTIEFLKVFNAGEAFAALQEEFKVVEAYKQEWAAAPYAPIFVTVDNLLVHNGHILLVQRKYAPGKGLWALPGGFLDPHETLQSAAIRELKEETCILVPEDVLEKSIIAHRTFDDPYRSTRGRTITTAFHIDVSDYEGQRPIVHAADDAANLKWIAVQDINPEEMFEDHYSIIREMLN